MGVSYGLLGGPVVSSGPFALAAPTATGVTWSGSLNPIYEDCSVENLEWTATDGWKLRDNFPPSRHVACVWVTDRQPDTAVIGFYGNSLRIAVQADDSRIRDQWIEGLTSRYQKIQATAHSICSEIRTRNLAGQPRMDTGYLSELSQQLDHIRQLACPHGPNGASDAQSSGEGGSTLFSLLNPKCLPLWLFLSHSPPACKADPVRMALRR